MKIKYLAVAVCALGVSQMSMADFPPVVIDSSILLNYNEKIDLTNTVSIPTKVIVPQQADVFVNQFNHGSKVTSVGNLINNTNVDNTTVEISAIGNNANIETTALKPVVGAVQGNQVGGVYASSAVMNNSFLANAEVEVNVTAVGNNLIVDNLNKTKTDLGSIQFNYESPVTAVGSIDGNSFGVPVAPRDPALSVTAIGNNLSSIAPTAGSMMQINRNSPVTASARINNNVGNVSLVTLEATAVGNNINISKTKTQ